ncbi:uncharacterized protein LOC115627368 [Scaptodrosophila lebanonensis]|uniref:Uncharacterized protein LOC115627368 n=1 Tax=Drosophila lebanonensis TaxID=7225 RepID=A0A6J2TTH7_DROLE|nr:uncharacterized protein LOC115627368 [Scaptodrosophila lebanonensis]
MYYKGAIVVAMQLCLFFCCLLLGGSVPHKSPMASKLILSSDQEPEPMTYQFITEYWPTMLGANYYIKPGNVVGSFSVDSGTLHFRQEDASKPMKHLSSKHNILFVASPKDQPEQPKPQQSEQKGKGV